jgi:coiled-coil-helix-coiled-coil-helix domain-containing protein 3
MGGSQSSAEAEREVTVEERAGDGEQPQIIVTQDFLHYVRDRQREEEEGEGQGSSWERHKPPPLYEDEDEIPHITAEDLISDALPGSSSRKTRDRGEAKIWQRKYQLEKEKNAELKHVSANEFTKAVAEVREKFVEAGVPDMLPVCEDKRNNVLQCYHSNPGKPLLCSQEVKAFTSCVERARQVSHLSPQCSSTHCALSLQSLLQGKQ